MRILLVTDAWEPMINGVVTSVKSLRQALVARGHEVRVLCLNDAFKTAVKMPAYRVGSLPFNWIYQDARATLHVPRKITRSIMAWHPDVIHTHCEFSTFFYAKYLAWRLGIPQIHTYHTLYEDYTKYFALSEKTGKKMVTRASAWILEHVDATIVPTVKVAQILRRYSSKNPPIYVVPTGVQFPADASQSAKEAANLQLRKRWNIGPNRSVAVVLGRVAYEKNIDEILRDLQLVKQELEGSAGEKTTSGEAQGQQTEIKKTKNTKTINSQSAGLTVLVVGDGPHRAQLIEQAQKLGIYRDPRQPSTLKVEVIFTGAVDHAQVNQVLLGCELFISASTSETQGLTTLEAMGCAVPLLCRVDPVLTGVLDPGKTGEFFANSREFCAQIIDFRQDISRWQQMGRAAAAKAQEKFSLAAFGRQVEDVYRQALANK